MYIFIIYESVHCSIFCFLYYILELDTLSYTQSQPDCIKNTQSQISGNSTIIIEQHHTLKTNQQQPSGFILFTVSLLQPFGLTLRQKNCSTKMVTHKYMYVLILIIDVHKAFSGLSCP